MSRLSKEDWQRFYEGRTKERLFLIGIGAAIAFVFCLIFYFLVHWNGAIGVSIFGWFLWVGFVLLATDTPNVGVGPDSYKNDECLLDEEETNGKE